MSIFATKSIEQLKAEAAMSGEHSLKRVLGPINLVTLGIGAIIGTGIFVLTGQAAAQYTGPAIVLSMVLAGFASALAGLCYSEFASTVPIAGSAYTYGYATLGEFIAWIIGWDLILEYALGAATVAVGWSGHLTSFLHDFAGIEISPAFAAAPCTLINTAGCSPDAIINLPAVLITIAVTVLIVIGIKESANVNTGIVIVKLAVVLIVIIGGAAYVNPANWQPFIPENTGTFGEYGWSGVLRGAGVIFFAYIGFDAVSVAAQEARNPQKDMPVGILGSLVVCTILYILVSGVMVGLVPYKQMLGQSAPMVVAIRAAEAASGGSTLLRMMTMLVEVGAIAGLSSVMVVMMMAQPRIFYSMANDGLLPPFAKKIHPKFRTPHITSIITGVAVALAAGFTPIGALGELVSIGTLLAFVIVSLGVVFLRYQRPELERPFKTPLVPFVPILSALVSFALMAGLPWPTWERLIIWMAIGIVLYFSYGYSHSEVRKRDTALAAAGGTRRR
ncbi:MAG TPA: amino acid permease [Vicinamibacterales bacterium]|jgi:APA family basic amino acid/polyamine antiporter|nr:amino acid permease [Vicinamibacterales bacterium]